MRGPVTVAVVGAGMRGQKYARLAAASGRGRVVAVADPVPERRARVARDHGLAPEAVFDDWTALVRGGRLADVAVVATQDRYHVEPAVALARQGYHLLLEKPVAPSEPEAVRIVAAVEEAGVYLAVCHVLRYTPYTRRVRALQDSGRLGAIVAVQHMEPVGWWHFAHSFVRGNWRREALSTSMLLAKSCHDVDWVQYVVGRRPLRISSFGSLVHFRADNAPPSAGHRCIECPIETDCPYSAVRLYRSCLGDPDRERWPLGAVVDTPTPAAVDLALREGPYGRCVYRCDNDVVDHQVVTLEYEGGVTASLTVAAFTPMGGRKTRILGTRGYLDSDSSVIHLCDFVTGQEQSIDVWPDGEGSAARGHGGGDAGLVDAFLSAVADGDPSMIKTGPAESLNSHRLVWAAERARRDGAVVDLSDLPWSCPETA